MKPSKYLQMVEVSGKDRLLCGGALRTLVVAIVFRCYIQRCLRCCPSVACQHYYALCTMSTCVALLRIIMK